MASIKSNTENDVIYGSDPNGDFIDSGGVRTEIFGAEGDDTIATRAFLATVHGGDGNDHIYALRSFADQYGDSGNDTLDVVCNIDDLNITNVSMTGGDGVDYFRFLPGDKNIYSATIMDFNPAEDRVVIGAGSDAPLYRHLTYDYNDDGDIVIHDAGDQVHFTLKDIKDFSVIEDATVYYRDYDGNGVGITTFGNALSTVGRVEEGTSGDDNLLVYGMYSSGYGYAGNDTISAYGYLASVYGGAGSDYLTANSNYVYLDGGSGDDYLYFDTTRVNENIRHSTMRGGDGPDLFAFLTSEKQISSAVIKDFSASDGDGVAVGSSNATNLYLIRSTNDDGDLVFKSSDGLIDFTMEGIKDFSTIADNVVILSYSGTNTLISFEEAIVPYGVIKTVSADSVATAYISSLYSGDIWLNGWDFFNSTSTWEDSSIVEIDARDAIDVGVLVGNTLDNVIYAGGNGNQLWGGTGNDTLIGGDGNDVFWAGRNEGSTHVVSCSAADVVRLWDVGIDEVQSGNVIINGDSNGVSLSADGSNFATIRRTNNASITNLQLADGPNWIYDYSSGSAQLVTVPSGLSVSGKTVSVSSDYEGDIWLSGVNESTGETTWGADYLTIIDAREDNVGGRILAGNDNDNTIRAGGGNGADFLFGGDGADTFVASTGEGRMSAMNYGAGDIVFIRNANFEDVSTLNLSVPIATSDTTFSNVWFNDGTYIDVLNPFDTSTTVFQFADGSFMRYNADETAWQRSTDGIDWTSFNEVNGMPVGVALMDGTAFVFPDYVGNFSLVDLNDSSISIISAQGDNVSGRGLIGDANNNMIQAGNNGSSLWGYLGDDYLYGGDGSDTFVAGKGEGNVTVDNYESGDVVSLWNADFDDLYFLSNYVGSSLILTGITMDDGTYVEVRHTSDVTTTIRLADDSILRYVPGDAAWQRSTDGSTWSSISAVNGMPVGVEIVGETAYVYSDHVGAFSLADFSGSSITNISATNDSVSGRVLIGDDQNNTIRSGNGGVSIYGGGGTDWLYGGYGADTFVAGQDEGSAVVFNCDDSDIIYLHNITSDTSLSWSASTYESLGTARVMISDSEGQFCTAWLDEGATVATFQFSDGSKRRYNSTTDSFQRYDPSDDTWKSISTSLAAGLTVEDDTLYVTSEYEGAVSLDNWSDQYTVNGIDASEDTVSGRVLVGDANGNMIYAGSGGSSMWGGTGGVDILFGGAGADTFVVGQNEGTNNVYDYRDDDIVYLHNVTSDTQLTWSATVNDTLGTFLRVADADSTICTVWIVSDSVSTANFVFADGSGYQYDRSSDTWSTLQSSSALDELWGGSDVVDDLIRAETDDDPLASVLNVDGNVALNDPNPLSTAIDLGNNSLIMSYANDLRRRQNG